MKRYLSERDIEDRLKGLKPVNTSKGELMAILAPALAEQAKLVESDKKHVPAPESDQVITFPTAAPSGSDSPASRHSPYWITIAAVAVITLLVSALWNSIPPGQQDSIPQGGIHQVDHWSGNTSTTHESMLGKNDIVYINGIAYQKLKHAKIDYDIKADGDDKVMNLQPSEDSRLVPLKYY